MYEPQGHTEFDETRVMFFSFKVDECESSDRVPSTIQTRFSVYD